MQIAQGRRYLQRERKSIMLISTRNFGANLIIRRRFASQTPQVAPKVRPDFSSANRAALTMAKEQISRQSATYLTARRQGIGE
jgi:hypothetical protein